MYVYRYTLFFFFFPLIFKISFVTFMLENPQQISMNDSVDDINNNDDTPISEQEVIDKIESLVQNIIQSFSSTNDCTISSSKGNVRFHSGNSSITFGIIYYLIDEVCGILFLIFNSFALARLMSVLNTAHYLLRNKKHLRKR